MMMMWLDSYFVVFEKQTEFATAWISIFEGWQMSILRWGKRLDPASSERVSGDPEPARQRQSIATGPTAAQPAPAGVDLPEQLNDWTERYLQSVQGRLMLSP